MALPDKQLQFLADYHKSKPGTSVAEFCRSGKAGVSANTVSAWGKNDEFKSRLKAIHRLKFQGVIVRRQPKAPAPAPQEPAGEVLDTQAVEVHQPSMPRVVPDVPLNAPELTSQQLLWLSSYEESGFQVLEACKRSGLAYEQWREMASEPGPFKDRYDVLEAQKVQALRDRYLSHALTGKDNIGRQAVADMLKVMDSRFSAKTGGKDTGTVNIFTVGVQMEEARTRWRDVFPTQIRGEQ